MYPDFSGRAETFAKAVVDKLTAVLFFLVLIINVITDISPAYLVVAAGLVGIAAKRKDGDA